MAKKTLNNKDIVSEGGITSTVIPGPDHAAAATLSARVNVAKTGQDTKIGPVKDASKKSAEQTDYSSDVAKEDKDALNIFLLASLLNQNDPLSYERSATVQQQIDEALKYYQPEIDAENAASQDARIKDREEHPENYSDYDAGISYTGRSGAGPTGRGTLAFGDMGRIAVGEKQQRVNDVIGDAAQAAGVNLNTMRGIWHVETKFSTLKEVSSTGCSGAFQFTKGTWAEMMLKHGDEIAVRLNAQGYKDDAAIALKYHNALRNKEIRVSDAGLQSQRFNGHIATYASAYYISDIAKRNGINAMNQNEGGKLYAAYNVGEGALRKLMNLDNNDSGASAMSALGRVAQLNPMFYRNGATAGDALANYQAAMDNGIKQYANAFGKDPSPRASAQASARNEPVTASREAPATASTRSAFHASASPAPTLIDQGIKVAKGAVDFAENAWKTGLRHFGLS